MTGANVSDLVAKYPLPDDVSDVVMNRSQIAMAMSVSENTISKWIAAGFPVKEAGGNGREYEFQLSDCYAWRCNRDAEESLAKKSADSAAAQMSLLFRNNDEEQASGHVLTAKQVIEESEADYKRNRAAEQRGELVRTAAVRELFEDTLVEFRTTITTLVDFAEMEFGLSSEEVQAFEGRCDDALVQSRHRLEQALGRSGQVIPIARGGDQEELPV